jgi:inosose dehydratase
MGLTADPDDPMWRIAYNPLPWMFADGTFHPSRLPSLEEIAGVLHAGGFTAIQADVPEGTDARAFGQVLAAVRLDPAPGYFHADFADDDRIDEILEAVRRFAAGQRELGLREAILACAPVPARTVCPGRGADPSAARLSALCERLGVAARLMRAEGVQACLHPHVGTWIETEEECDAVLGAVAPEDLLLAPDNGHLLWAGVDPVAYISRHRERVGALHLKDVHLDRLAAARQRGDDLAAATSAQIWAEPGRGDVDLDAILRAVGPDFGGWVIVEVDVFDEQTPQESVRSAGRWARAHLANRGRWGTSGGTT